MSLDELGEEKWDCIVHGSTGVSHVVRRKRGELPMVKRTGCDD